MTAPPRTARPSCAVCGVPAPPPFAAPPPELAPDLDLRPGEPTRSTQPRWIATCRACGLSAPDLARPPAQAAATVRGAEYQALRGPGVELAALRHALLLEAEGAPAEAADAVMQAAWARDDAGQDAAPLRLRAAALWGEAPTMQDGLRQVDALRRAGADGVAAAATRLRDRPDLSETDRAVLDYQLGLIVAGDRDRHLLSAALRPPAQRPHVTHGRLPAAPRPRGLFARLFGS